MSEPTHPTPRFRYECLVHASNRDAGTYGLPVSVVASNQQEAVSRAITAGWLGERRHARVTVRSVAELDTQQVTGDTRAHGLDGGPCPKEEPDG